MLLPRASARVGAVAGDTVLALQARALLLKKRFVLLSEDFAAAYKSAPPQPPTTSDFAKDWEIYRKWEAALPAPLREFRVLYQDWRNYYGLNFNADGSFSDKTPSDFRVESARNELISFEDKYESSKRALEKDTGKKARDVAGEPAVEAPKEGDGWQTAIAVSVVSAVAWGLLRWGAKR